jgi:hypothetical protein
VGIVLGLAHVWGEETVRAPQTTIFTGPPAATTGIA